MQIVHGRRAPELARGEVLADFLLVFRDRPACSARPKACLVVPGKGGVIALLLKSGIALSHHDVSKKDLDLGLSVH